MNSHIKEPIKGKMQKIIIPRNVLLKRKQNVSYEKETIAQKTSHTKQNKTMRFEPYKNNG